MACFFLINFNKHRNENASKFSLTTFSRRILYQLYYCLYIFRSKYLTNIESNLPITGTNKYNNNLNEKLIQYALYPTIPRNF